MYGLLMVVAVTCFINKLKIAFLCLCPCACVSVSVSVCVCVPSRLAKYYPIKIINTVLGVKIVSP